MTKINNIIELNGKRYDARTGALLEEAAKATAIKPLQSAKPKPHHTQNPDGRVIDGIIRGKQPYKIPSIPIKPRPKVQAASTTKKYSAKLLTAHHPEHSKTLMRHIVKPPQSKTSQVLHAQSPANLIETKPAVLSVKPKLSSEVVDDARLERSKEVPRSKKVIRFDRNIPLKRTTYSTTPKLPATQSATPALKPHSTPQKDIFEKAIANASSHEQPAPSESYSHRTRRNVRKHIRRFSISAAVLAMLLLGSFVAYQNKVSLEMQVAAARAGFPASLPGYKPAGFAANQLTYSPGTVTIGYHASGNQTFNLIQKESNWDNETLLQNYVADTNQPYQAYNAAGRTIYIYGSGNGTWVNGGVWYQISGNAHLNNQQIINIATSM